MASKVAYVVFDDDPEMMQIARDAIKAHNFAYCGLGFKFGFDNRIRVNGKNTLSSVMPGQELYIFAHGNAGTEKVGHGNGDERTALTVVRSLKASGLTRNIKVVKLYCCMGGFPRGNKKALGFYFKEALQAEGFVGATVYAYQAALGSNKKGYDEIVRDIDGSLVGHGKPQRLTDVRVKF
jgi:hypothetical protein